MISPETPFKEVSKEYELNYGLSWLHCGLKQRLAFVGCVCYLTNELNKKRSNYDKLTCYDVLSQIAKKNHAKLIPDYLKAVASVCQDFMSDSKEKDDFTDFGIPIKEMPKFVDNILDTYLPF